MQFAILQSVSVNIVENMAKCRKGGDDDRIETQIFLKIVIFLIIT